MRSFSRPARCFSWPPLGSALVPLVLMAGCADSHGRGTDAGLETDARTLADAGEIVGRDAGRDAPEPSEPCAMGRRETVIEAPLARQAGFYALLVEPHVTSRGDRVSAAA
ncbi:MAG: hypothetical protein U0353_32325, partial [Sandaracinus sp.]